MPEGKQSPETIAKRLETKADNDVILGTESYTVKLPDGQSRTHTLTFKKDSRNWIVAQKGVPNRYHHKFSDFMTGTYELAKRHHFNEMGWRAAAKADEEAMEFVRDLTRFADNEIDKLDGENRELRDEVRKLNDRLKKLGG